MMKKLTKTERSRLKITVVGASLLYIQTFFPMYVILTATDLGVFELTAAWSAWAGCIATIATLIGYYVNKDTQRPSFVNNTIVDVGSALKEDESDPEEIPL